MHGTHRALVQHNVVYNNRGPSIYIEDGNEIENVVEENVIICSELNASGSLGAIRRNSLCRFKDSYNRPETSDSDYDEASGIYFLSSYNHVVGNRVSGYDNAMYVNAQGGAAVHGLGQAEQRACVSAYPFGYTVGNVFHNNAGFGWYANTTFPQDMVRNGAIHLDYSDGDSNIGTVTDWSACQPFSRTGEDPKFQCHNSTITWSTSMISLQEDTILAIFLCTTTPTTEVISLCIGKPIVAEATRSAVRGLHLCKYQF